MIRRSAFFTGARAGLAPAAVRFAALYDDVKLAPLRILEHLVEARAPVTALGTADTGIVILRDDLPAPPFGDLPQGGDLVLDGLLVGGNPDIDGSALHGTSARAEKAH